MYDSRRWAFEPMAGGSVFFCRLWVTVRALIQAVQRHCPVALQHCLARVPQRLAQARVLCERGAVGLAQHRRAASAAVVRASIAKLRAMNDGLDGCG